MYSAMNIDLTPIDVYMATIGFKLIAGLNTVLSHTGAGIYQAGSSTYIEKLGDPDKGLTEFRERLRTRDKPHALADHERADYQFYLQWLLVAMRNHCVVHNLTDTFEYQVLETQLNKMRSIRLRSNDHDYEKSKT